MTQFIRRFKLEGFTENPKNLRSRNEWNAEWTQEAPDNIIVELMEAENSELPTESFNLNNLIDNSSNNVSMYHFEGSRIIVRPEEAIIVLIVLLMWVGAVALFFNRWGKIRMLEPYIPKYEEAARGSCTLDMSPLANTRTSFSSKMGMPTLPGRASVCYPRSGVPGYPSYSRNRQNSVFVGPHIITPSQPPRKTKSATDIHSLILCEVDSEV